MQPTKQANETTKASDRAFLENLLLQETRADVSEKKTHSPSQYSDKNPSKITELTFNILNSQATSNILSLVSLISTIVLTVMVFNRTTAQSFSQLYLHEPVIRYSNSKENWTTNTVIENRGPITASDLTVSVRVPNSNLVTRLIVSYQGNEVNLLGRRSSSGNSCEYWLAREVYLFAITPFEEYEIRIDRLFVGERILITVEYEVTPEKADVIYGEMFNTKPSLFFTPVPDVGRKNGHIRTYFINKIEITGNATSFVKHDDWYALAFPRTVTNSTDTIASCERLALRER